MKFVGDKSETYDSELPATAKYPVLKLAEFQSLFHFMSNETEAGILHQVSVSRIKVHKELECVIAPYEDLSALSKDKFEDEEAGTTLYKQAVFALTASELIGIQLSGDATAEAAQRQEALTDKKQHCEVQYRQAIDLLVHGHETYCFEVV
ncbi:head completion/stabilization protein [Vibrio coralliilyticus]|uniref:head completion/stabilization protein n=1 Tax=Vibrio coralliilyticus TaxID=190893 RepID=UPI00148C67B1|nr:head completion/stabilization protein [Vibrio coralliilyticus]NOI29551.1 head completion/stabilization protein [Vibrio coralliilyticus]NOI48790.1 head completion/stabilization protein [Vibrio coralliilyticus]